MDVQRCTSYKVGRYLAKYCGKAELLAIVTRVRVRIRG